VFFATGHSGHTRQHKDNLSFKQRESTEGITIMTITSRERVEAALNHKTPDRTPVFEYVLLSPIADKFLGRLYAADRANWTTVLHEQGWENAVRQSAIDKLDLAEFLGHDMIYSCPNFLSTETGERVIPSFSMFADPVEEVQKNNDQMSQLDAVPSDDIFFVYVCLKEEMQNRGIDLPIIAPAYVHGVWDNPNLMQTMLLDPEVAHQHFALATQRGLAQIEKYIQLGIDQIGVGGDFAGNKPLISPETYKKFIVPEVRTLSRRIHAAGRYAINASDGDLWSVLDDFLIGCEVDGYLEIDMHAGMDLRKLKERYGDRITFYGNLDCGNILSFGSPEQIKRHTIECVEAGQGNGGHILSASNAITPSITFENYLVVVDTYRDMFHLDKLKL
jgi:Uroporphyrinogen decarboxylase (URO-D)